MKAPIENGCSIQGLVFAPSSPAILYAAGSQNHGVPTCRYVKPVVSRSTDGGATWEAVGLPSSGASASLLAVDPVDPQLVYAATMGDLFNPPGGLLRSTDGGVTWSEMEEPIGTYWRISALAAPRSREVWAVQDYYPEQRIFRSGDAGETWQESRENLLARTVYQLASDPASPERIYAATSNGVWVLTPAD